MVSFIVKLEQKPHDFLCWQKQWNSNIIGLMLHGQLMELLWILPEIHQQLDCTIDWFKCRSSRLAIIILRTLIFSALIISCVVFNVILLLVNVILIICNQFYDVLHNELDLFIPVSLQIVYLPLLLFKRW